VTARIKVLRDDFLGLRGPGHSHEKKEGRERRSDEARAGPPARNIMPNEMVTAGNRQRPTEQTPVWIRFSDASDWEK